MFAGPALSSPDPHKREMKTHYVSGIRIDERSIEDIQRLIDTTATFRSIRLIGSVFKSAKVAEKFCTMVRDSGWTKVAIVNMSMPASAILCLADSIKHADIQGFEICDVELFAAGVEALAAAFRERPGLHTVVLQNTNMSLSGCAMVTSALRSCAVEFLDFSHNPIGATFAAHAIYTGCKLTRLSLGNTGMGQSGFETLCSELLRHDVHLLRLSVDGNDICDVGCAARLLSHPRSRLRNLDLSSNNISSVVVLREAIFLNRTIMVIWLENNRLLGDADIVSTFLDPNNPVTNLALGIVSLSGTLVSPHIEKMLDARLSAAGNGRSKAMIAICTAKVPRLGARGAAINKLPTDIIRLVAGLLPVDMNSLL